MDFQQSTVHDNMDRLENLFFPRNFSLEAVHIV
jgi:hypothetical protein